jgi:hypothetical protein
MTDTKKVMAWHFVGDTLRDGRPVPPDGEWLEHDGDLVLCESGLHASEHPFDALRYAPGLILCRVELGGRITRGNDKLVAEHRRIVARLDATDLLRQFARSCALDVIHLWDAPDVVRQFLTTGDESIRAAAEAASWATEAAAEAAEAEAAAASAAAAAAASAAASAAAAAAEAASWAASGAASWAASGAAWAWAVASGSSARAAAKNTHRQRFADMVEAAFKET